MFVCLSVMGACGVCVCVHVLKSYTSGRQCKVLRVRQGEVLHCLWAKW